MWIKTVFFAFIIVSANCASKYSHQKQVIPNKNQRIIKVHSSPQFNHFHNHPHKHIVTRPFMLHQKEASKEFIRSSQSSPRPPFFNGPSTNHIKHLPRPPPHVVHKIPSYGSGFPYKSVNAFRTNAIKIPLRTQASGAIRAPLGKQTAQVAQVAQPAKVIPSPSVLPAPQIPIKGASASSSLYSPTFAYSNFFSSSPIRHIISSDDNNGPIREIPAPNLGPKSPGGAKLNSIGYVQSTAFANSLEEPAIKIKTAVKKPAALDTAAHIKILGGHQFSEGVPSFEIKGFEQTGFKDFTKLFKNVGALGTFNVGYEVKEPHNNVPSNDQILKTQGGEKFYYAPDPDPSLPVHKVPPTNDPQSTPSNGQSLSTFYFPQLSYGFPYLPGPPAGGSVSTLTPQELYQLMQGYPTVLSQPQPVVTFVGQPQANNAAVQEPNQNYYIQQNTKEISPENDIAQYLQRPDIHNLIHNTPETLQQQNTVTTSTLTNPTENLESYSHQTIYQDFDLPHSQSENINVETSEADGFLGTETNNNYDFEPEASESKNSFTVIRQSNEDVEGSAKVKKLLLEDSNLNNINLQSENEEAISSERVPEIFELKNAPEVPLYSSLPNQQAAEALAGLQAAGSVASNYINQIKIERLSEDENENRRGKSKDQVTKSRETIINLNNNNQKGTTPSIIAESVDDESISEDSTEFTSEGHIQDDLDNVDFKDSFGHEAFGKRLRPK